MNRDEFARNLAAGTYDLIVLDMLRDKPSYGYGIVKRVFEQSKHTIRWHEGTLYPVLHRLEKRGLLASEWKGPPSRGRSPLRRGEGPKAVASAGTIDSPRGASVSGTSNASSGAPSATPSTRY